MNNADLPMPCPRIFLPLLLGAAIACAQPAAGKPAFTASEIEGKGSELLFGDLDGDHLDDAVLIDDLTCSLFFQDAKSGFPRQPQQVYRLEDQPSVVWPAKLGGPAASLLVWTSRGVTELDFTNRTAPPARRQIIEQPTIIPDTQTESQVQSFPLAVESDTGWPLLLVPVADGLQVWQHGDGWRQAQFIPGGVVTRFLPEVANPGYTRRSALNLCVGDVNHDGREDLMVMRPAPGGTEVYTLYLQTTNGLFDLQPALVYTNTADWHTALAWCDLNHSGRLDLITSTISDEPSFVPGLQSGKVIVATYGADAQGRIPPAPQQVFRKGDWSAFLPLVDVDGDGYLDLVLGYVPIDSRDGVRNLIAAGKLNLNLKFHFSRPGRPFLPEPDYQRSLSIYFDHDLIWTGEQRIYYEKFLSLNGDFNGDGKKDLLVRDHSDAISVFFFQSRTTGFSTQPDLKFHCPEPVEWWRVKDLNSDGISDLVVKLRDQARFRIFTSQGQ